MAFISGLFSELHSGALCVTGCRVLVAKPQNVGLMENTLLLPAAVGSTNFLLCPSWDISGVG